MREFTRYSRSISNNDGSGMPMHRPDNPIGVREDTGLAIRSAGKQFYDPGDSLVGAWLLDEGLGLFTRDYSIYNNHGLLLTPDWVDDGLSFVEANSDVVTIADAAALNFGFSDFSIALWVKSAETTTNKVISKRVATADTNSGYAAGFNSNKFEFGLQDGSGASGKIFLSTIDNMNDDAYHFLVGTFDRDDVLSVYADGVFDGNVDISAAAAAITNTNPLFFGRDVSTYIDAEIHSIFFYNKVLTSTEIDVMNTAGMYRLTESYRVPNV